MKGRVAYLVGSVAGAAFIAGWLLDPAAQTTMVTALVCGIAAVLGQLSTRDFLARAQQLIDRGIDEVYVDGGELLSQARVTRERIDQLALTALVSGVLAPFFGTLRSIYSVPLWAAAAFACAVDFQIARGRLQPGFDKEKGRFDKRSGPDSWCRGAT